DTAVRMPFHAFVVVVLTVFHALRMVVLIESIRAVTNVLMAFHTTVITVLMAFQTVLNVSRICCSRCMKSVLTAVQLVSAVFLIQCQVVDRNALMLSQFLMMTAATITTAVNISPTGFVITTSRKAVNAALARFRAPMNVLTTPTTARTGPAAIASALIHSPISCRFWMIQDTTLAIAGIRVPVMNDQICWITGSSLR